MIHRLVTLLVLIPVAVILIALAAANRVPTPFTIDPFQPGNPEFTIILPLFVWLFAALVIGLIIGSCATWLRQGRYRRAARQRPAPPSEPGKAGTSGGSLPARS